ncbi:MAG TPA: VCBS repeat-containing protein [Myxococcota bacterium]|nr:VCBS repeat-containing protein [Myxococcota bacterium]
MWTLWLLSATALAFPWTQAQEVELFRGTNPWDEAGAATGDLDGDGDVDLMFHTAEPFVGVRSGRVEMYDVGRGGLHSWLTVRGQPTVNVGRDTGLADLDCDGALDLVIPSEETYLRQAPFQGALFVFYGPFAPGWRGIGDADAVLFDSQLWSFASAAAIGADLDGDGCGDVVVGGEALRYLPVGRLAGRVDIASLPGVRHLTLPPRGIGASWTRSLVGLSDVDGDGLAEVLVSMSSVPGVFLINGRPTADGALLDVAATIPTQASVVLTEGVSGRRDLDGDGQSDLALLDGSVLRVFSGAALVTTPGWLNELSLAASFVSSFQDYLAISMIQDVNGDGLAELAVKENLGNALGQVLLVPGSLALTLPGRGALAPGAVITPAPPLSAFGDQLFDVGDVDGDGRGDPMLIVTDGALRMGGFALY